MYGFYFCLTWPARVVNKMTRILLLDLLLFSSKLPFSSVLWWLLFAKWYRLITPSSICTILWIILIIMKYKLLIDHLHDGVSLTTAIPEFHRNPLRAITSLCKEGLLLFKRDLNIKEITKWIQALFGSKEDLIVGPLSPGNALLTKRPIKTVSFNDSCVA